MGWVVYALVVALAVYSISNMPKPESQKPASLEDANIPIAEEGKEIPVIFGTVHITGPNVVGYWTLDAVAIRKKGGKK